MKFTSSRSSYTLLKAKVEQKKVGKKEAKMCLHVSGEPQIVHTLVQRDFFSFLFLSTDIYIHLIANKIKIKVHNL